MTSHRAARVSHRPSHPRTPPTTDFTRLPDDRVDLSQVFLAVDVSHDAPPGTDLEENAWVVRYSSG